MTFDEFLKSKTIVPFGLGVAAGTVAGPLVTLGLKKMTSSIRSYANDKSAERTNEIAARADQDEIKMITDGNSSDRKGVL